MRSTEGYLTTRDDVRLFYRSVGAGRALIVSNATQLFEDFKSLGVGRNLIAYDLRNRGRSDAVKEPSKIGRGIQHDVEDLEDVRRHFRIDQFDVIGHSYLGMMVVLYALEHPDHVRRVVQIGPAQPDASRTYPPHLRNDDGVLQETLEVLRQVSGEMGELLRSGRSDGARALYKMSGPRFLRLLVADPAQVGRLAHWDFSDLPNEITGIRHWQENIEPSIRRLGLTRQRIAQLSAPVLTLHGVKDRNAPYGGGREWALWLSNARLVTIEAAAHVPWIEAPQQVFGSIETFLGGVWPPAAEKVTSLDPAATAGSSAMP
jgi:pimeloyl-ACP methyl ester carboxylesterase